MAEAKRTILIYSDWESIFSQLEDHEAGILIKHFFSYVNDKNPVLEDRLLKMAFEPMKLQLKRDLVKWNEEKEVRSQSGIIGNLKRWNTDLYNLFVQNKISLDEAVKIANDRKSSGSDNNDRIGSQSIANIAVNVNDNVSVNDNVIKTNSIVADFPSKKSATQILKDTFDLRKADFRKTLIPFTKTSKNPLGKFDGQMVKEFFEKWTEPNKSRSKMKFEMEKTWDVELRLGTWNRNDFGKKNGFNKNQQSLTEHLPYLNKIDHSNRED